jgi:hypothetical protein
VTGIPVVCDRHGEKMARDEPRKEHRCPVPGCVLLITDEARYYLLAERPGIREIRVDELSARQEEMFRRRPELRGTRLDLGYR